MAGVWNLIFLALLIVCYVKFNVDASACSNGEFHCKNGACASSAWRCDGEDDCGDNSDEETCRPHKCAANEFDCGDVTCISAQFRCNRKAECLDRRDEKDCNSAACGLDKFKCAESGHCVEKKYRCNGRKDCLDGSDEISCQTSTAASTTFAKTNPATTAKVCPFNNFKCKFDQICIHNSWLCDGAADCKDGEDESKAVCDHRTCTPQQFACKNGKCISNRFKCDSTDQCGDNSDEVDCPGQPSRCRSKSFKCKNSTLCIEPALVCNKQKDCPNGDDEPANCDVNECLTNSHGCSHGCVDMKIGYKCTCSTGYSLVHDNKTCVNVDECHQHGVCSQKCIDLKGSFKCFCMKGYILDGDLRHCRASGQQPLLIFSNRGDIRQIQTNGQHYKPVVHTRHIKSAIAIDVDAQQKVVYWADNVNMTIGKASLVNADQVENVVTNVEKPEGIALDWIGKKIYWTNTHPKYQSCVEVANLDGSQRLVLVHKKVDQPRAIAVHPIKRLIFWTDWGAVPKIERMSMDGLMRQVVVSSENVAWPNGLTIDLTSDRIFWVDGKKNYIGSSDLDGSKMVVVASGIQHPFGLTVFEDYVYWTNYRGNQVFRANKFTGKDKFEFQDGFFSPMGIQIYHPVAQQLGSNPCAVRNGGCSHLCLLSAVAVVGYSCACPTEIKMLPDGKTCDVVMPTTQAPVYATTVAKATTVRPGKLGCQKNQFMCLSTRKCIASSKVCDGVNDCPDQEDEVLPKCNSVDYSTSSKKKDADHSPLIAGIVAGIAFIILVIVIIVLIVCKRRRSEANLSITFLQDQELLSVHTVKFKADGTHWPSKEFENINFLNTMEREELINDPGLMAVPDDNSSDNSSTCDETKPVMHHQQSSSSNSVVM